MDRMRNFVRFDFLFTAHTYAHTEKHIDVVFDILSYIGFECIIVVVVHQFNVSADSALQSFLSMFRVLYGICLGIIFRYDYGIQMAQLTFDFVPLLGYRKWDDKVMLLLAYTSIYHAYTQYARHIQIGAMFEGFHRFTYSNLGAGARTNKMCIVCVN